MLPVIIDAPVNVALLFPTQLCQNPPPPRMLLSVSTTIVTAAALVTISSIITATAATNNSIIYVRLAHQASRYLHSRGESGAAM
jgi:hypothetical protein